MAREVRRAGLHGIALESDHLGVAIFPEAGGKIMDLVHRPSGTELLWHNPRVGLAATYAGAAFDDVWCGGWDEVFPTDVPCSDGFNSHHDHGDLWIGPWEASVGEGESVLLERSSPSLPCTMRKRIELVEDAAELRVSYRLENLGHVPVEFMWDIHVAHAIRPGSRIHVAAGSVAPEPPFLGRVAGTQGAPTWPRTGDVDLSVAPPPETAHTEFLCLGDLERGACAVSHPDSGLAVGLEYSTDVFPYLWLFGVYGGWRGHYVLLTEPCTSPPGSLCENAARGAAARLKPGEALETELVLRVTVGLDMLDAIAFD
jgi:galactose mutarotase-like enzyme